MGKKVLGIIASGVALMLTLTSCTRTAPTDTAQQSQQPQKTQVSIMNFYQLPAFEALVESAYEDIDLVVEQNASATLDNESERRLRNGHGSDLIMTTLPGKVRDYTYDLSAEEFVLNYSSAVMKTLLVDGQTHFVPLPGQYYGYIVNQTLIQELGFELPKSNQELYAILQAATDAGVGVGANGDSVGFYNIGENYIANMVFGSYVPDFLAQPEGIIWLEDLQQGKAKFSGAMEPSMDFLLYCRDKGYFDPGTVLTSTSVTIANKNAVNVLERLLNRTMVLAYGNTELKRRVVDGSKGDDFTIIPFLSSEDNAGWVVSIGNGYLAVNQALAAQGQEKELDAALRVLALLSTQEGQRAWMADNKAVVSYLKDGVDLLEEVAEGIRDTVAMGYVFDATLPTNIVQYFGRQMSMVVSGKTTLAAAMSAVDNYNRNGADSSDEASAVVGRVSGDMLYENYNTRKEETAIGNLIADAVRELSGAEIAFVNGGGIRSSLYEGDVWDADLSAVCPYGNTIITVRATGAILKEALANGISQTNRGENVPGGRFLQVSGLRYSYRPMKDENDKGELLDATLPDGAPLEDDKTYLVAITNYMGGSSSYAEGNGDGYVMLNVYDENTPKQVELVAETGATFRDALKAYFASHQGESIAPTVEGRITLAE